MACHNPVVGTLRVVTQGFIWAVILAELCYAATSYSIVHTKLGRIKGISTIFNGGPVTRFLGVPYARAPLSDQRFQPPQKHMGWAFQDLLDATESKHPCPTEDLLHSKVTDLSKFNEDCLYLNIYVPANLSAVQSINTMDLSVLVVFNDQSIYSSADVLNIIARRGNLIVVGVEFRHGVLGFLSTADEIVPGNQGLLDQKLATHWIWDNIRELGGNPEKITLFGNRESATYVGLQMLSSQSRGFFVRTILQSGTMLTQPSVSSNARSMFSLLSKKLGCTRSNDSLQVHCLQKISLMSLLKAADELRATSGAWLPVIDGTFLTDSPLVLLSSGQFSTIDSIVGIDEDDGRCEVNRYVGNSRNVKKSEIRRLITEAIERRSRSYAQVDYDERSASEALSAVFLEYSNCFEDNIKPEDALSEFYFDSQFASPAELSLRLLSRHDRSVYFYLTSGRKICSDENTFRYGGGGTGQNPLGGFLLPNLIDAWLKFAKEGNPGLLSITGTDWKPFTELKRYYMNFSHSLNVSILEKDMSGRRMAFWNDYYPHLQTSVSNQCSIQLDGCTATIIPEQWLTVGLSIACAVLLIIVIFLACALCRRRSRRSSSRCCWKDKKHNMNNSGGSMLDNHEPPYVHE